MTKIARSPQRHTFQAEAYVKRCKEEGKEPNEDYLNMYKSARQQDEENMVDPEWSRDNMEYDLRTTDWILKKVTNDVYAQNLYAAMCNMRWQKIDVFPILKDQYWSCSWRSAGGIVADMREQGDYINWYCSGIRNDDKLTDEEYAALTPEQKAWADRYKLFVGEGVVTDEIKSDLHQLGWQPVEWEDD